MAPVAAAQPAAQPAPAAAQAPADESGLEEIYDRLEDESAKSKTTAPQTPDASKEQKVEKQIESISDLGKLAAFKDIAVIQRKFLPRTQRFDLSGSFIINTNNQFFNNIGLGIKLGYSFNEKYGIEGVYNFLTSSPRPVTKGLEERQIDTESFVEPEGYMGLNFKWTPVYGKIAWFEKKIIPFELYFTPGFGMTQTARGSSDSTFSLGFGQLFAMSKSTAIRWDFNWNFYQSEVRINSVPQTQNQNDLLLMVGYSFLFPEAKYR